MTYATKIKAQQAKYLIKLVGWYGSQAALAAQLGTTRQAVSNWVKRGRISATYAIKAEKATLGAFKKEQLRPDVLVWGDDNA